MKDERSNQREIWISKITDRIMSEAPSDPGFWSHWVRHSAYDALAAENVRLREALDRIVGMSGTKKDESGQYIAEEIYASKIAREALKREGAKNEGD